MIILLGLGSKLISLGFLNMFLGFISRFVPEVVSNYNNMTNDILQGSLITIILRVAILAPIFEELIFRGLILKRATKIMPFYAANILQALLFALFHMNVIQFTYAFPAGLLYGYVTLKYRSLTPVIYLHMFGNGVSILISTYDNTAVNPIEPTMWSFGTITIVGALLLYTCYCMMKRGRYLKDVSANSEVSTREVLVNYTNHSDLIECPDYIVGELAYYQEEFEKLALINNCYVSLETFIQWVNKTHLKDRDEKINIIKRGILPTEEQGKLPQLYY
ncbi:MAG TPA: CPBP family intramembrane metalloprotease [Clostridiales bacterium]|nr:CPBP family intramembrane metalloprotease [Clostridiales bacterium]